mgnify:CR=1 FL=1
MSIDFLSVENANTFLTKVSEKIDTKHINDFVRTQIQSQNLTLDDSSSIFYIYIPSIQSYLISTVKSKTKNVVLEPFVFSDFYLKNVDNKNLTDLFICKNFFAVYYNKKLIYFSKIQSGFLKDDIIKYINQTFKKQIDNTYDIKDEILEEYKKSYISNIRKMPDIDYVSSKKSKGALFFLSYLLVVILVFAAFLAIRFSGEQLQNNHEKSSIKLKNAKKEYESLFAKYVDNQTISTRLVDLFNVLDDNGIELKNIKVSREKSQIIMIAKDKNTLLDFLDYYDEDSTINHMKYIEEDDSYEMVATIRLYK